MHAAIEIVMKNKIISLILTILLIITTLTGCNNAQEEEIYNESNNKPPQIQVYPEPLTYERKILTDANEVFNMNRYDLRHCDASQIDFTKLNLTNFVFDSQTIWSDKLPPEFNVNELIEYGKKPGLGINSLHEEKITGKGINVGIIDGRLLADHSEFKDNIVLYEEIFEMEGEAHYHGTPITSLLCGKNIGVAPDVNIYYIAYLEDGTDYEEGYIHLANAIERIIEINKDLPKGDKIRVLSISSGWDPDSVNAKGIYDAIEKAKKDNIFVVTAMLDETHELFYDGARREPVSDPESLESYYYENSADVNSGNELLLFPLDARWLASATGQNDYVMYTRGAWSMIIPYVSGLYALACQVNSEMTPELFWNEALLTGYNINEANNKAGNIKIINPVELISKIR